MNVFENARETGTLYSVSNNNNKAKVCLKSEEKTLPCLTEVPWFKAASHSKFVQVQVLSCPCLSLVPPVMFSSSTCLRDTRRIDSLDTKPAGQASLRYSVCTHETKSQRYHWCWFQPLAHILSGSDVAQPESHLSCTNPPRVLWTLLCHQNLSTTILERNLMNVISFLSSSLATEICGGTVGSDDVP